MQEILLPLEFGAVNHLSAHINRLQRAIVKCISCLLSIELIVLLYKRVSVIEFHGLHARCQMNVALSRLVSASAILLAGKLATSRLRAHVEDALRSGGAIVVFAR